MKYITPKQKAHNLIVGFLNCDYTDIDVLGAKQCAFIALDNLMMYNPCCKTEAEKYFEELRKEIEVYKDDCDFCGTRLKYEEGSYYCNNINCGNKGIEL